MQNANESKSNTPASAPSPAPSNRQPPKGPPPIRRKEPPTSADNLAMIGAMIRGERPPEDVPIGDPPPDDDEGGGDGSEHGEINAKEMKSLEDIAKRLKIDPAKLYDIEIPLRAGSEKKSMKLGELKDYHDAQDDHSLSRIEWEEERGRQEAELARSRTELAEIMKMIPNDKLNPEVLDAVRKRQDAIVVAERRRTLEKIPAWRDENLRASELQMIADHLADYGFPASALATIYDHRMISYLRDNALRLDRLNKALERVKSHRVTKTAPRSKGGNGAPSQQQVRPSTTARTVDRQVADISNLLRGSS